MANRNVQMNSPASNINVPSPNRIGARIPQTMPPPLHQAQKADTIPANRVNKVDLKEQKLTNGHIELVPPTNNTISIDDELVRYGYIPIDKIITRDQDGNEIARYIKAVNVRGQPVFVELDIDGMIAAKNDITLVESNRPSIIPFSIRHGSYNDAGNGVSGVAFECSNGICTLIRGNDSMPKEENFTLPADYNSENRLSDQVVAYPVVKFSEIRTNPDVVRRNIDTATSNIRNTAYINVQKELVKLGQAINSLSTNFANFYYLQARAFSRLPISIKQIQDRQRRHGNKELTKEEYENMLFTLKRKQEQIAELLKLAQRLTDMFPVINQYDKEISTLVNYVNTEFANI